MSYACCVTLNVHEPVFEGFFQPNVYGALVVYGMLVTNGWH